MTSIETKDKLIRRYVNESEGPVRIDSLGDEEKQQFDELCAACRMGDLEQVDRLVSSGVNINAIDMYDYTPLILASLCGHEKIVRYLLNQGALCDRDTFQGERCIYGALNDSIRQLLLQFDISKSVDVLQPFAAHVSSFLRKPVINSFDLELKLDSDRTLRLHRFILQAQSQFFANLLKEEKHDTVEFGDIDVDSQIFVIRYLYLYDQTIPKSRPAVEKLKRAAEKFQLGKLIEEIEETQQMMEDTQVVRARKRQAQRKSDTLLAQEQFDRFFTDIVLASAVELDNDDDDLTAAQFGKLNGLDISPDVLLQLDLGHKTVYIPGHKAMLVRSEYFEAMFSSGFAESSEALPVVDFPASSMESCEIILRFLYTDKAQVPLALSLQVMQDADMLLIDRLKTLAAITVTNQPELPEDMSIYAVLRLAWELRVDRLEQYVAKNIAARLESFVQDGEFAAVVAESANRIKARQETDTIELIDDIRYYLAKRYGIIFEDDKDADGTSKKLGDKIVDDDYGISQYEKEYNMQLDRIDELLSELELQA